MSAVYTIFTSPDHPPVPDHLPTLIVTPAGKPGQILYTYLHTNYNRENYLLTPSPQGDLCVAKLFPPAAPSSRASSGKSASEGHASQGPSLRTVKCEASRNFKWSITNSGVLTPSYKCTLPSDDSPGGLSDEQPLFQISKTNPSSPFWTCWYYAYAGHLIPPKRIQFGHISKNIGPDGKAITGGGTRVTITGKSEEEKAVWKTLGEGNEDMVEWAVISAALHVLDDEIVKAAEAAGIRIGVMPGAVKEPNTGNSRGPPSPLPGDLPKPQLHPTGHRPDRPPPSIQGPPVIPNSREPQRGNNGGDPRMMRQQSAPQPPQQPQQNQQQQPSLQRNKLSPFNSHPQQQQQQPHHHQQSPLSAPPLQSAQRDDRQQLLLSKTSSTSLPHPQTSQLPSPLQGPLSPNGRGGGMYPPAPLRNPSNGTISPPPSMGQRPLRSQQNSNPASSPSSYHQPTVQTNVHQNYSQPGIQSPGLPRTNNHGMPFPRTYPYIPPQPSPSSGPQGAPRPLPAPGAGSSSSMTSSSSLPDSRLTSTSTSPPTRFDGNGSGTGFDASYHRPVVRPASDQQPYQTNGHPQPNQRNGQQYPAPFAQSQSIPNSPRRERPPQSLPNPPPPHYHQQQQQSQQSQQQYQQASRSPFKSSSQQARSPPQPQELKEEDTVDSVAFMLGTAALNDAVTLGSTEDIDNSIRKEPLKAVQPAKDRERSRMARLMKHKS